MSENATGRRRQPPEPPRRRPSNCLTCPAFAGTLWEALPAADVRALDAAKTTHHFGRGAEVFAEGDPAGGVWCVGAGLLCIRRRNGAGTAVPIRLRRPGAVLGLRAFIRGGPFQATAETLAPARICFVAAANVRSLLSRNLDLALAMVRGLIDELSVLEHRLMTVRPITPRTRLAALLLEIAGDLGLRARENALVMRLPLPLADIASIIGVSLPIAAGSLAELADDGIVTISGRRLEIRSLERLRAVAGAAPPVPAAGY